MTAKSQLDNPKVAVIGSGYWGRNLVRNLNDLNALKLICDRNEMLLGEISKNYPEVATCVALNDVLSGDDIHGVAIATPAETHFNLTREVLLAGKHALVEKPLVLHEKEAEELITLAEQRDLILMVGHLLQYHPAFVRLEELAAQGELGRINYIYSHRLNLGKIRREENILWSFAPHDISMILALAGEPPECVSCTGGNYLHQRIADVTTTHLEFASGLKAHIFVSWLHPFKDQKLVVVGDRKMAVFDDTMPWPDKLTLFPHQIKWEQNMPVPNKAEPERVDIDQTEPLRLECQHFLRCISTSKTPRTDGREGLRVLSVLKASQRSLDDNGTRIWLRDIVETGPPLAFPYSVHPTAIVDEDVKIGAGTKIWHFSHILAGSRIGERCNIAQNVVIGPDVVIGNGCKVQNNVSVFKGVTLEESVFCGPSVVFTNVFNPRAHIGRMNELRPTLVKRGATIGANATVVCGHIIGRYAFVGAGAVVTKDVPDHAIVVGNPARPIGWMCHCGARLNENLICTDCEIRYLECGNGLEEISSHP